MAGRRLNLVHSVGEDKGPEAIGPRLARSGQAVTGFATFYIPDSGWVDIPPGRLELSELWGGAEGYTKNTTQTGRSPVEFYIEENSLRPNFVAVNGALGDVFTFGFFGKRYV